MYKYVLARGGESQVALGSTTVVARWSDSPDVAPCMVVFASKKRLDWPAVVKAAMQRSGFTADDDLDVIVDQIEKDNRGVIGLVADENNYVNVSTF